MLSFVKTAQILAMKFHRYVITMKLTMSALRYSDREVRFYILGEANFKNWVCLLVSFKLAIVMKI